MLSTKNNSVFAIFMFEILTNEVVNFEQLGPDFQFDPFHRKQLNSRISFSRLKWTLDYSFLHKF